MMVMVCKFDNIFVTIEQFLRNAMYLQCILPKQSDNSIGEERKMCFLFLRFSYFEIEKLAIALNTM